MKRFIAMIAVVLAALTGGMASHARGIDPQADSIAIMQMRQRMAEIRKHRPTVALVLGGGGAKGASHVGVIRYIESLGIPIDMVLGTSMGGLIGGLYSLGYSVDQIDTLVRTLDWQWAFSDQPSREYISYADAKYREKYMLSIPFFYEKDYYKMKLSGGQHQFDHVHKHDALHIGADKGNSTDMFKKNILGSLPSGYIFGQNVTNLISSLTVGYQDSLDFKEFPIPYACVASDMVSGKAKIWHGGKMNDAMRSTMSIPGIFAPVRVDGMVLVDGGLRDNYPAALARDMGADYIIGVELSQPRKTYQEVNNLGDILGQGIEMMMWDALDRNIMIPDVKIKPDLKEFNMMSFNPVSIDTIIVRGYEAAASHRELLEKIASETAGKYTQTPRKPAMGIMARDSLVIANVDIKGVLPKEKEILKEKLHLKYGQKISFKDLDHVVATIYGTQAYDYVTYELLGKDEPFDLVINCRKGPVHQFGLGVRADSEEIVSVLLNLGFNVHKLEGHMFDLTGKISANPYVKFHWSYDLPKVPTFNASASMRWTDLSMLNFGNNRLSFNYLSAKQEFYLSNMEWRQMDVKAGFRNEVISVDNIKSVIPGDYDMHISRDDFMSVFAEAETYTFDDGYFPTRGVDAGLSYSWTFAGFPRKFNNFHTVTADAKVVVPVGEVFAFIPSFNFRFLFGNEIPVPYFNAVGGSLPSRYVDQQIPFVGVNHLSAMKNILTVFRTDYRFRLARNHYITGILNYARDCDSFLDYAHGLGYFGAAAEYSFDTIFGPITANVHWSNMTGRVGFYLSAGYNF